MTARCPKGHASDESDYCSICGAPIAGAAKATSASTKPATHATAGEACPSCGEPRAAGDARFCEVCRFDFVARREGPPPVAKTPAARATPVPPAAGAWELVVAIDPALDTESDPSSPCPLVPPSIVAVDRDEMLVGRRDDRRDIKPEIALHDPGASRRHAKILRSVDGALALLDLASTNGTRLNGADMPAGSRAPLRPGDEIVIGRWTRITVRARA